jgi:hypothetical protein
MTKQKSNPPSLPQLLESDSPDGPWTPIPDTEITLTANLANIKRAISQPEPRWQVRALMTMLDNPEWSAKEVAAHVRVSRQTLYRDREVGPALRARNKQKRTPDRRSSAPRGTKDPETHQIEAEDHRR